MQNKFVTNIIVNQICLVQVGSITYPFSLLVLCPNVMRKTRFRLMSLTRMKIMFTKQMAFVEHNDFVFLFLRNVKM